MADAVDTTNVAESVPEVPAEVVSKETITDPEAGDVEPVIAEAEKPEVPVVATEEKAEENGKAEVAEPEIPKENGSTPTPTPNGDDKVSKNGSGTNGDDNLVVESIGDKDAIAEERKRKQEALEASLEEPTTEVSAEKKAKLEEKSEVKQDEVENSPNGEAEVAA